VEKEPQAVWRECRAQRTCVAAAALPIGEHGRGGVWTCTHENPDDS
jgi:hypothetical protein